MPSRLHRVCVLGAAAALLAACGSTPSGGSAAPVPTVTVAGTTVTATVTATRTATKTAPTEPAKTVVITTEVEITPTAEPGPETTTDDSSGPPTGLALGAANGITFTTDDGGADVVVLSVKRVTDAGGEYGEKPSNGNYILVDVQYTGTKGSFSYNPFDWLIRDPEGRTYDLSAGMYGGKVTALNSGTLSKGSKARGTVVFDAPKGPLTLEFGGLYGGLPATWKIPA